MTRQFFALGARRCLWQVLLLYFLTIGLAIAGATDNSPPLSHALYLSLKPKLEHNAFNMPFYVESLEGKNRLQGDVYGLLNSPFATVTKLLQEPGHWCDIMILHLNVKYCRNSTGKTATTLTVYVGRKFYQPLADAYQVDYDFRVSTTTAEALKVIMTAKEGPMGSSDYLVSLEAIPVAPGLTFIHFGYSYAYGTVARLSMLTYLNTLGRDKVGFTQMANDSSKKEGSITGVRSIVERNTMRYYLALQAFLAASSPAEQEQRLRQWFALTERFPAQLHEVKADEYLVMKRAEIKRQLAGEIPNK